MRQRFSTDVSMILVEGDHLYSKRMAKEGLIAVPEWVRFKMDISRPMQEIVENWKKRGGQENLRKIRKHRFTCKETQNPDRLHEFYHHMYLPHLRQRIGNLAHIASLGHMRGLLENGTLLLLKNQAVDLAGMLISARGATPRASFIAVRHANPEYLRQSAMSALYYHGMIWAQSQGYRLMDFGHCRPIMSDGLFRYKRRWGMRVEKSDEKHRMLYLWCNKVDLPLTTFAGANPLVCEHEGKLKGLFFHRPEDPPSADSMIRMAEKYSIPGLHGFHFVALKSDSPEMSPDITST